MGKRWKQFLCRIFGHKTVCVIEYRKRHDGTCKKRHPKYYSPRDYGRGHWIMVGHYECARCGKKLTEKERYYEF